MIWDIPIPVTSLKDDSSNKNIKLLLLVDMMSKTLKLSSKSSTLWAEQIGKR